MNKMIKRKYSILMVLGIILISLSFQNLTFVTGIDISITDPEDDVIKDFFYPGDYFNEIDIVKLEVEGQITNLTVAGNLTDWEGYYYSEQKKAQVMIFEDFDMDLYKKTGNFTYPYYSVDYQNWTISFDYLDVFFVKHIDEYLSHDEYWTGSGYSPKEIEAQSVGNGSGSSIIGNVSMTDYIIPDNATIFAITTCGTLEIIDSTYYLHFYFDFAPDEFNPFKTGDGDKIPSYNLWIVAAAMIGISIYIVIKRMKRK